MPGHKQELAVGLVRCGNTYQQAADAVGLTRSAVAGACYRAGVRAIRKGYTPEGRESAITQQSKRMRALWRDAGYRERVSKGQRQGWQRRNQRLRQEAMGHVVDR